MIQVELLQAGKAAEVAPVCTRWIVWWMMDKGCVDVGQELVSERPRRNEVMGSTVQHSIVQCITVRVLRTHPLPTREESALLERSRQRNGSRLSSRHSRDSSVVHEHEHTHRGRQDNAR